VTPDWGLFLRTGFASPDVEPDAFTDIDRTVATGAQLTGRRWRRPDDTIGFAGILNGISGRHEAFLNAGGLGILVGDGRLPHPGLEQILETYYSVAVKAWHITFAYQFVNNPAYNCDRGPVSVLGLRLHAQFLKFTGLERTARSRGGFRKRVAKSRMSTGEELSRHCWQEALRFRLPG
jgi:high affinity Mn2+ porin